MNEERITDVRTGGAKGRKLARFDLIPPTPLWRVAEQYGVGAKKYEDRNWERGYAWSLSFGALMRHAQAFWMGEDYDGENGQPHLAAVVFHALALMEFGDTCPELDDRPAIQPLEYVEYGPWGEVTNKFTEEDLKRATQAEFDRGTEPLPSWLNTPPLTDEDDPGAVIEEDCPRDYAYLINKAWWDWDDFQGAEI